MGKAERVRKARPQLKEVPPVDAPKPPASNRKARRAAGPPVPNPMLIVELPPNGKPEVRWLNGATAFEAPTRLRHAARVVEQFLDKRLELEA